MSDMLDLVVVGAGQAGLAISRELARRGLEHVVLERGRVGETWRGRWESFCLVTPNWSMQLPDQPYDGDNPDAFDSRDEIVGFLERYAARFEVPVHGRRGGAARCNGVRPAASSSRHRPGPSRRGRSCSPRVRSSARRDSPSGSTLPAGLLRPGRRGLQESGGADYWYVDPETFHPVQFEWPNGFHIRPPDGPELNFDLVGRSLTYEYLPRTAANVALADIRAKYPHATVVG